jgi:hypothetical protein
MIEMHERQHARYVCGAGCASSTPFRRSPSSADAGRASIAEIAS